MLTDKILYAQARARRLGEPTPQTIILSPKMYRYWVDEECNGVPILALAGMRIVIDDNRNSEVAVL